MKKILNKQFIIIFAIIITILMIPNTVHAGLQANKGGTSLTNKRANTFFTLIRGMEQATLGKSDSSNLDCHMIKNTEWGTVEILCSAFGSMSGSSTTGNESGIMDMFGGKNEYVAGIFKGSTSTLVVNLNSTDKKKYYDEYENSSARLNGDGLSLGGNVYSISNDDPVWARRGPIFVAYGDGPNSSNWAGGYAYDRITSRAVVCCGESL